MSNMSQEYWKPLCHYKNGEFANIYEISNHGRLKSVERYITNRLGRTYRVHSKIINPHKDHYGYLQFTLWKNHHSYTAKAHRLVALEFLLDSPDYGKEVNHIDENKENNNLSNLEWCTHLYNNQYGTSNKRAVKAKLEKHILRTIITYDYHTKIETWYLGLSQVAKLLKTNERLIYAGIKERNQVKGLVMTYYDDNYKERLSQKVQNLNNSKTGSKDIKILGLINTKVYGKRQAKELTGLSMSSVSKLLSGEKNSIKGYQMFYTPYCYNPIHVNKSPFLDKKAEIEQADFLYKNSI